MIDINVIKLREITENAKNKIKLQEQADQAEILARQEYKNKVDRLKAEKVLSQVSNRCEKEAKLGRRHAIIMSVGYDDYSHQPGYNGCKSEYLVGVCKIVYDELEESQLNPSLEDWHDGIGINGGYNIIVSW